MLEMLPAGPLPPNAAEFVRSQALSDVLARLAARADLVFVDAPAMLAVSDAINLTPKVDALIVLARLPAVKTAALKELERVLENAPVTKLGFIVTGAESDDTFSGGYGYGYGYGGDAEKPSKTPSLS
jgi:Mrp family chromosome partitioning ATPase